MHRTIRIGVALCPLLIACSRRAPQSTPEGALHAWLDKMEASTDSSAMIKDVYASLGSQTRAELEQRAHRTTQLTGRNVEPWEMIANGWFGLRFRPHSMRTRVAGDHATVDVDGADPTTEHAVVQLTREGGLWKVELGAPMLETH